MATMRYRDNDSIYSCEICCKKFQHPNIIYYCAYGHYFCQNCFNEETYKDKNACPRKSCKALVYKMSNESSSSTALQKFEIENGKKMFPPDLTSRSKVHSAPTSCNLIKHYALSTQDSVTTLSKKPISCPYPRCRKSIAVSSVNEHFRYEHKLIASITTQYEVRNELKINPSYLETNQPTCVILINLTQAGREERSTVKPIFLVMASNIMNIQLNLQELEDEDYSEDTDGYNCYQFDKAIFWIASNIVTKSKYTLALSTICKTIRVKYYGLLSQINDDCLKLSEEGKGLILHQMQILKMTNHGKKPLSLDFIIHEEEIDNV